MIALYAIVDVDKAKEPREPWSMKPCSGCKRTGGHHGPMVREDVLEMKTVIQSR
uniref:Uncharacterized protein n=1 Tax=Oryza rufipogon TaxID=4529 RepID=A0A0E0R957_ORYRU